jgi:hypothetical protein
VVTLGRQRRALSQVVEGVARRDVKRTMDIDQVPSRSKKIALKLRSKQNAAARESGVAHRSTMRYAVS